MTPPTDEELIAAARAVVERWDTPHWKDVPATAVFINRLRDALAGRLEGRGGKERAGLLDAYEAFIKLDFMATAEILVMRERERIRRSREYDHPVNRAGRALGGLWRSIASGGWE